GIYEGNVRIKNEGKELVNIVMKINVLPFKLGKSHEISSIYYYPPSKEIYGENVKEQFRKDLKNLLIHGVDNPVYKSKPTKEDLQIRKEAGIENQPLFIEYTPFKEYTPYSWHGNPTEFTPEDIEKTKKNVKEVLEIVKEFGIKDVYFYGWDETIGVTLLAQRPVWEAIHEAGGKVFVSGYTAEAYPPGNFALVGDIQDLLVCAGYPSREEAEKWHAKGHKIVCYGNPQGGIEAPDTYRRNFGILLWQYNYDGAMTYCYHWEIQGFGPMWSDWCERKYKAHNMVYPTGDGVIDTLQWEGYREGIDDVRYLNVLIEEVKKAKDSQMVKKEAQKFLEELKKGDINRDIEDMDTLRLKIIDYIMKLKGKQ
ncbi:MAG TPA: hypothetical protein P5150_08395, partial [Candidatus Ratteibacteria bacterium]|nr:hypothetical protein [Candidatus Ratteibacteria bacterium]